MSKPAISAENVGKMYQLGHREANPDSFREALIGLVSSPWKKFRQLSGRDGALEEFWALRDASFEVQPGDVVGIIGKNGAGKSTLLKILSRIVEPTRGQVVLRGRVASLLEVGTGFHPELSGRENIYLNGSILGMKKREIDAKFEEIVEFAEISQFLDTPVKRYSSGMYVRLAFAVAANLDPEILIVDEVLAVGDADFQRKCLGKMREFARSGGRTVIFVSHNMTAVKALCERAIMLDRGTVVRTGAVSDVIEHYLSLGSSHGNTVITPRPPTNASVRFTRAEVRSNRPEASVFRMGDELTLSIDFESESAISHPRFGFVLSDSSGTRLLGANNRYNSSTAFPPGTKSGTIEVKLGLLPLNPGHYHLSLWLGTDFVDTHVIEDGLSFEMAPHDLWGEGKAPPLVTPMWWPVEFYTGSEVGQSIRKAPETSLLAKSTR